jgi:hypothetical protein
MADRGSWQAGPPSRTRGEPGSYAESAWERFRGWEAGHDKGMTAECPECGGEFMNGPHPNYDHLHPTTAEKLPRSRRTEGRVITRGYAVGMSGHLPQIWVFFSRIEPAYAFGRAGRMATTEDIRSYGVYESVCDVRWDQGEGRELRTLLVAMDTSQREIVDGQDLIARWVRWTSPRSSYFLSPRSER